MLQFIVMITYRCALRCTGSVLAELGSRIVPPLEEERRGSNGFSILIEIDSRLFLLRVIPFPRSNRGIIVSSCGREKFVWQICGIGIVLERERE